MAVAMPAFAQGTSAPDESEEAAPKEAAIVVTGSLIRRDEFGGTAEPMTVITDKEITQAGFNSATDALQSNQVTQGAGQINNYFAGFVTDGGTGANTLGLRGLGPSRTLLLLNGHRLAPAGTRGSVGSVDTNVLPRALINRIEILKAGASSIYGSDAIAGVVNIITDTKLEGLIIEGQTNVPEVGSGVARRLSASFGHRSDRLSIIGSVEWYKRTSLSRNDVDFTKCPIGGYLSGKGTAFGSGDFIDPVTGTSKCFTLDNGGVTINTLGVPTRQAVARGTNTLGNFNRLVPAPGQALGTPGYEGVSFYTRDSFDPAQEEEELVTPAEIYTGFAQLNYQTDILGDAEIFLEVLGNQRKSSATLYRQLSLDYLQNSPLVPVEFRSGRFLGPNETSSGQNVAARAFIGYGNTASRQEVDFARIAGGLRGDFVFPDWRYEAYVSKSWSDATYEQESFLTDRIAKSLNVVQNMDGSFSCASLATDPTCVAAPALTGAIVSGNLPQAYRDYIVANVIGTTKFREFTTSFNINGPLFELPGGSASLALGAEYRDARIDDTPPDDSINSNLFNLTSASPTRGSDSVWEVYGELFLPLLADVPGAYRLNLGGSARYTHYDSYGGDYTYKVSGEYEPIKGLAFRGSYGTSYRAPALFEQFLGGTSGFLSSSSDPCGDMVNQANPVILANCLAAGVPANFTLNSSVRVITGGGATSGLEAETSRNLSGGIVIKPPLPTSLGTLSVALDYFDIKVNNGVARAGAGNILNLCYGDLNFSPTTGFCRLITRDPSSLAPTVNNNYINLSTDIVRGFELNTRYANDIGPGRLIMNGLVTKYQEQSSRLFADDPLEDANGTITTPEWTASFDAAYNVGSFTIRYGLDWVEGDHNKTYEFNSLNDDGSIDTAFEQFLRDNYYFETNDYFLHSLSVQYGLERFTFTAGVRNMFDKQPPRISADLYNLVGNAPLYSGYDYTGRTFFVNASAKF